MTSVNEVQPFEVGDIVILKSDGPAMTVTEVIEFSGKVRTSWFSGKKCENGVFPTNALERAALKDK